MWGLHLSSCGNNTVYLIRIFAQEMWWHVSRLQKHAANMRNRSFFFLQNYKCLRKRNNRESQQEPVPQDVELSCTGRALTYPQRAAGLSNYLYLQPDSQVDAQPQFAFGILWFWLWTYKSIKPFLSTCVSGTEPPSLRGGSATLCSDTFHLEVSEASVLSSHYTRKSEFTEFSNSRRWGKVNSGQAL